MQNTYKLCNVVIKGEKHREEIYLGKTKKRQSGIDDCWEFNDGRSRAISKLSKVSKSNSLEALAVMLKSRGPACPVLLI